MEFSAVGQVVAIVSNVSAELVEAEPAELEFPIVHDVASLLVFDECTKCWPLHDRLVPQKR